MSRVEQASDILRALQEIRLFSDVLRADQLEELAGECSPLFFPVGAVLMRQGDIGASMFCITEGVVSVSYADSHHRTSEIRQIGAGNVIGEIELMTGERRIATVTAVTDLRVLEINKAILERLLAKAPDLIESFGSNLALRMAILNMIVPERRESLKSRVIRQIRNAFPGKHGR